MTVKELREKLEGLHDDMEVVAIGYYGEAIRQTPDDFRVRKGPNQLVPYSWYRNGEETDGDVFEIPVTNLGPEPD